MAWNHQNMFHEEKSLNHLKLGGAAVAAPSAGHRRQVFACPGCGAHTYGHMAYCPACGYKLSRKCPACGSQWRYEYSYTFCPTCGTQWALPPRQEIAGQGPSRSQASAAGPAGDGS